GSVRSGERRRIGQVEGLADELQFDLLFDGEGAGNVLVDVEEARAAQNVSACGTEGPRRRVGEGCPAEIRGIGIVAAQDLDWRIDLRRRLALAAGVHVTVGADGERQAAKPAEGTDD